MPNIKVISKYFPDRTVMDESCFELEEKKIVKTGPRNSKKSNKYTNNKIKKKVKHVKGQKDIRTLVKNKQSEIVSFSKDFDKVCKQTGVDIDSEQLQLAIALSKSIHKVESVLESNPQNSNCLTSQERVLKIRTTLQEYGFKIPKTKITVDRNKRKRCRKQYKLLHVSEIERQQNISDKYSEVLAKNIFRSPIKNSEKFNHHGQEIYYKSSNISYEHIKNDVIYYVKNLFDKPSNKIYLLKDWSKIPGRPSSPKLEGNNINFDTISCSQHDLDHILSGSILTAQEIIRNKSIDKTFCNNNIDLSSPHVTVQFRCSELDPMDDNLVENISNNVNNGTVSGTTNNLLKEMISDVQNIMSVSQQTRSVSPDLFDDDDCVILDSKATKAKSLEQMSLTNQPFMDLTDCINNIHTNNDSYPKTANATIRNSNDLMELTECALTNLKQLHVEHVDLTYCCNDSNNSDTKHVAQYENIDLTQTSNLDDLPLLEITKMKKGIILEDRVILAGSESDSLMSIQLKQTLSEDYHKPIHLENQSEVEKNLKENSNKDGISPKESLSSGFIDEYRNSDFSYEDGKKSDIYFSKSIETIIVDDEISFISKMTVPDEILNEHKGNSCYNKSQLTEIDLTQSSDSSQSSQENNELINSKVINDNLGKKDNVSIDYDELFDVVQRESISQTSLKMSDYEIDHFYDEAASITVKNSEIIKIPGDDFNDRQTSLHKSTHDSSNFGDILIPLDLAVSSGQSANLIKSSIISAPTALDIKDKICNLPKEIIQKQPGKFSNESSTPVRISKESNLIFKDLHTPTNNDYKIKTNDVTPMADYSSMSSPERNKELDKYGLKPIKRKRAIQFLTYLYNQTHPLVESFDECSSPSKRQKQDSTRNHKSPKKNSKSLRPTSVNVDIDINKENDIYTVTKYLPDIKQIECNKEDWVFQKREKVKVHSCRVPLHITFHNYVSCRQKLREAILQYEPINMDIIHKDLVASGHKYNPKDLLKFLDKKCITVKTSENNPTNRKS